MIIYSGFSEQKQLAHGLKCYCSSSKVLLMYVCHCDTCLKSYKLLYWRQTGTWTLVRAMLLKSKQVVVWKYSNRWVQIGAQTVTDFPQNITNNISYISQYYKKDSKFYFEQIIYKYKKYTGLIIPYDVFYKRRSTYSITINTNTQKEYQISLHTQIWRLVPACAL